MKKGLVIRSTGSWYDVRDVASGTIIACRLKGKFKIKGFKVTNPLTVGDYVVYELESGDEGNGIITEIVPRENYIIRQSVHKTGHSHLIGANLDQAALVVTLHFPRTSLGFIDRFLVTAESFRIPSILLFNKQDLINEEMAAFQDELIDLYESLGYKCLKTTAISQDGIQELKEVLLNKVTLLSGHSGAGKSSLINAISPELGLRTSEVSAYANKGVHTTTFAEMFEFADNTFVIDTPGIKELGLVDMTPREVGHYFPEIRDLMNECRFDDCLHINEPGCAVKEAVEEGSIAFSRFDSYLSMVGNQDNRK